METINNIKEFSSIKSILPLVIDLNNEIPNQIFVKANHFVFIEFLEVSTKNFFNSIISLKKTEFIFYSIVPDPEKYYFPHFSKFNVFKFNFRDSSIDYLKLIHEKPNETSADAIMDIVDKFVVFSKDLEIVIYGDRDFDLMILGFDDLNQKLRFISEFGENRIFSLNDIQDLILSNYPNKYDFIEKIKSNFFSFNNGEESV
jgi:hypothetical protein